MIIMDVRCFNSLARDSNKNSAGNRVIAFYLFIFLFCIYLFTAQGNNIISSDQQEVRFETTRSIVEKGELAIPDGMGVKGNYGKDYSWYGVGYSVLAIPFYVIGSLAGGNIGAQGMVSIVNQVVVALSGVIIFSFIASLGYARKTAFVVTIFYALGTIAWPQSKHPFDHPVEMLFVLLAIFYAQIFAKSRNVRYILLSSASLGFAFLTRPPTVLALPSIFALLALSRITDFKKEEMVAGIRDCVVYSLAFIPFLAVQLWYNYARFGSIYETGITLMAEKAGIDFFAGTPLLTGLAGFLYSPGKGFFYYSPISILFFLSISGFYRRNKGLAICIIGIVVSYLLFLSRNIYWHGDWSWGPRYLFVITPLIILLIADLIERYLWNDGKIFKSAVFILFGLSMLVQIIGVSVNFIHYFISLQVDKGVQFTSVGGNDVPYILEPPAGTHFEWDKFPIVYQASSALKIWKGLKDYRFIESNKIYEPDEALKYYLRFNVFDFWWLYALYTGAPPYAILLALLTLSFVMILSLYRIVTLIRE